QTLTTDCGSTTLGGTQAFYDGSTTLGAIALDGACLPTKTLALAAVNGSAQTWAHTLRADYDADGRVHAGYDALARKTATPHGAGRGSPGTSRTVSTPAGRVPATTLESAWGTPTAVVDANGKRTVAAYDPTAPLLKVWLPGRDRGATPNLE